MDPITLAFIIAGITAGIGAVVGAKNATLRAIFAKYGGEIPAAYLATLAKKESGHNPAIINPASHATGLFQITMPALSAYNKRNGTAWTLSQLFDADRNTMVAADHLKAVVRSYRRFKSLTPDWSSRRWVELLTLGWNAGDGAITTVAQQLDAAGRPVTVDTVSQAAAAAPSALTRYIAEPGRVQWSKQVADLYLRTRPRLAA